LEKIGSNNLKVAWDGVKKMIGLQKTQNKPVQLPMYKNEWELSEALNFFHVLIFMTFQTN